MDLALLTRLYAEHVADLGRRYAPILAAAGYDAVAIHSGSLLKRSEFDDQYWPLRATPHFQHWVPLAEPDCAVVVRPGQKPLVARLRATSFWEKPAPPETDHFQASVELVMIDSPEQVKGHLPSGRVAFIGEAGRNCSAALWGIPVEHVNPVSLVGPLDGLRVRKTEYEVLCLEEANRRAAVGHERVRQLFLEGGYSELELHLAYLQATAQDDPETPYKNIVALDENAATLHHISYGRRARGGSASSLLLDAGASYQGYCSDITRTWVKGGGAAASVFGELVNSMEAMQQRLCAAVRVGMPYEALHDESHRQVGAILVEAGLVRGSAEEAVTSGISRAFFPHGLGHSLGLQCHDVGCAQIKPRADNPFLRNTTTIAPGQVFTVEPGLYFIEGLLGPLRKGPNAGKVDWPLVDDVARLGGIRIEDDVVVTEGAASTRNLTREFLPVGGAHLG